METSSIFENSTSSVSECRLDLGSQLLQSLFNWPILDSKQLRE